MLAGTGAEQAAGQGFRPRFPTTTRSSAVLDQGRELVDRVALGGDRSTSLAPTPRARSAASRRTSSAGPAGDLVGLAAQGVGRVLDLAADIGR